MNDISQNYSTEIFSSRRIKPAILFLILNIVVGSIYFYKTVPSFENLYKDTFQIINLIIILLGIFSYICLFFSNPGFLTSDTSNNFKVNEERKKNTEISSIVGYGVELKNLDEFINSNKQGSTTTHQLNKVNIGKDNKVLTARIEMKKPLSSYREPFENYANTERKRSLKNKINEITNEEIKLNEKQYERIPINENEPQSSEGEISQINEIEKEKSVILKKNHYIDVAFERIMKNTSSKVPSEPNNSEKFGFEKAVIESHNNGFYSQRSDLPIIGKKHNTKNYLQKIPLSKAQSAGGKNITNEIVIKKDLPIEINEEFKINENEEKNISEMVQDNTTFNLQANKNQLLKNLIKKIPIDLSSIKINLEKVQDIENEEKKNSNFENQGKKTICENESDQLSQKLHEARTCDLNPKTKIENSTHEKIKAPEKNITSNFTEELEVYYCRSCFIDIPLRAKHCKECNKCVSTFDHHCVWVGNCIGEQNKNIYVIFLFLMLLELVLTVTKSIVSFNYEDLNTGQWIKNNILLFLNVLGEALLLVFVGSLFIFHVKLISINQTTWENLCFYKINYMIKFSKNSDSPFNYGIMNNLAFIFCKKKFIYYSTECRFVDWKKTLKLA